MSGTGRTQRSPRSCTYMRAARHCCGKCAGSPWRGFTLRSPRGKLTALGTALALSGGYRIFLELNATDERLQVDAIGGAIPNRGSMQETWGFSCALPADDQRPRHRVATRLARREGGNAQVRVSVK
jgi:hypothetical protein